MAFTEHQVITLTTTPQSLLGWTATPSAGASGATLLTVATSGVAVGMGVSGTNIASGTVVTTIGTGTVTISKPTTGSVTSSALLFSNALNGQSTTVFVQLIDATNKAYIGGDTTVTTSSYGLTLQTQWAGATVDNINGSINLYGVSTGNCNVAVLRTIR